MKRQVLEENVNRFDRALKELRHEHPTHGIERVDLGQTRRKKPWLLAGAGIAGTAVIAVVLVSIPAKSHAIGLGQVRDAIEKTSLRHTTTYRVGSPEDGKMTSESWGQGKWTRVDYYSWNAHIWSISDDTTRWTFNSIGKSVVTSREEVHRFDSAAIPSLLDVIRKREPGNKVELVEKTRDGKHILELTDNGFFFTGDGKDVKRYPLKTVWIANADDKLPRELYHYQAKHSDDGRKIDLALIARGVIESPSSLPKGLFDHSLPKGWKAISKQFKGSKSPTGGS